MRQRLAPVLALTATLWLLFVPAANAYIDGGSATLIFQAVVAGIAAGGMFLKLFWRRITGVFGKDTAADRLAATEAERTDDAAPATANEHR